MSKIGGPLVAAAAALLLALLAASPADTSPQDIQHYTRYAYGGRGDDVDARVRARGRQGTEKSAAAYSSDRGETERANNRRRVMGTRRGLGSRQRGDQVELEYVACGGLTSANAAGFLIRFRWTAPNRTRDAITAVVAFIWREGGDAPIRGRGEASTGLAGGRGPTIGPRRRKRRTTTTTTTRGGRSKARRAPARRRPMAVETGYRLFLRVARKLRVSRNIWAKY